MIVTPILDNNLTLCSCFVLVSTSCVEVPMLLTALALSLFLMAAAVRVNEHAAGDPAA